MISKVARRGPWLTTYPTATKFYPTSPHPDDVHIEDIAHSLPMQARFLGHTLRFYSVGEHSCHVGDWIWKVTEDREAAACGLLHDAEEAYVGDMPRPLKHFGGLKVYRSLCGRCSAAVFTRFGLTDAYARHESLIKTADDRLLHTESRCLHHLAGWEDDEKILSDVNIEQFAEQEVIDLLDRALRIRADQQPASHQRILLEARAKLMQGGVHARWRREFMERFERWVL